MAIDDMDSQAAARRRAGLTASTKSAVKKKTPSKTIVTPVAECKQELKSRRRNFATTS